MTINAATKAIAHTILIVRENAAIMVADEESDSLLLEVSSVSLFMEVSSVDSDSFLRQLQSTQTS